MVQEGLGAAGKWYREGKEVSLDAAEAKWSSIPWGPLGDEADIVQNRPSEIGCPLTLQRWLTAAASQALTSQHFRATLHRLGLCA